jgi:hypothetical protein
VISPQQIKCIVSGADGCVCFYPHPVKARKGVRRAGAKGGVFLFRCFQISAVLVGLVKVFVCNLVEQKRVHHLDFNAMRAHRYRTRPSTLMVAFYINDLCIAWAKPPLPACVMSSSRGMLHRPQLVTSMLRFGTPSSLFYVLC